MNKRKIVLLAVALVMVAILGMGSTLAYFMDTDVQVNTFTVGNVAIDLYEDFGDNDGIEHLVPATGSAQDGTLKNGIEKEVYVKNTGSEDAYVRVHIAIPTLLDNGRPDFDASSNVLHFNYATDSIGENLWDWSTTTGAPYEGSWNYYETTINEIAYNVYVVTYGDILSKDEATCDAMSQVYLDSRTTNEDITKLKDELGDKWMIYVVAEGAQADGFTDAYDALNTSFGVPGADYEADFTKVAENSTWVNVD